MTPLILASGSPRRQEIMGFFDIPIQIEQHQFDERSLAWEGCGHRYAIDLAMKKAQEVSSRFAERIVIGADTIVVLEEQLLHKPRDKQEAFETIQALSGKWHHVITGLCVIADGEVHTASDETRVWIRDLSDEQIEAYLNLNLWSDKVGGYAIQRAGSLLVKQIQGCYYNVIGLPVGPLADLFETIGIDLWHHLRQ